MYQLVKKDFLLAKSYWIVLIIAAVSLPAFIHTKLLANMGGFPAFFLSSLFIIYLMFNSVSMAEDKFRGAAYLCATPYMRDKLVLSKYVLIVVLFVGCLLLYTITAWLVPMEMDTLGLYDSGLAFLIIQAAFSVIIPVQYRYGYEKSRYMFFFMIFITPFAMSVAIEFLQSSNFETQQLIPFSGAVQGLFFFFLAIVVGLLSMMITKRFYATQDL